MTRVFGIDPGSRVTGYGVVEASLQSTVYIASGCIECAAGEFPARLEKIYDGIRAQVARYAPDVIAIERVFVHKNADSALKLGQARAAAICATFGGGVSVYEYAARAVKQSVVGRGGADKRQVQHMVKALLTLDSLPPPDEADALAVAICHAHSQPATARLHVGEASA